MWGRNRKRSLFNPSFSIPTQHWCCLRALTCMTNIRQTKRLLFSWVLQDKALTVPCKTSVSVRSRKPEDTLHLQILGRKTSSGLDSLWTLTLTSGVSSRTASPSDICQAFLQAKRVCLSALFAAWTSKSEGHQHPAVCTSDRMGIPGLAWVPPEFLSSHWPAQWAPQLNTLLTPHWAAQRQISSVGRSAVTSSPMEYVTSDPCSWFFLVARTHSHSLQGDVAKGTSYLVPWEWMCFLALVPGILGAEGQETTEEFHLLKCSNNSSNVMFRFMILGHRTEVGNSLKASRGMGTTCRSYCSHDTREKKGSHVWDDATNTSHMRDFLVTDSRCVKYIARSLTSCRGYAAL